MSPTFMLLLALVSALPAQNTSSGLDCTISQITKTDGQHDASIWPSLDGGSIAFLSTANLAGENTRVSFRVFLFDGSKMTQITPRDVHAETHAPTIEAGSIAFPSSADFTGQNPDESVELFLFDGSSFRQVTRGDRYWVRSGSPDFDGSSLVFVSKPGLHTYLYHFDGSHVTQLTPTTDAGNPSADGGAVAFESTANLTGENPGLYYSKIFLLNGSSIIQVTPPSDAVQVSVRPSLDSGSVAYQSTDYSLRELSFPQIYLFDGSKTTQITPPSNKASYSPSLDNGSIAFYSQADLTGNNPDGNYEIFLFDGSTIHQITDSTLGTSEWPSLDGNSIAFFGNADLTGENPDRNREIFLATCPALAPPPGPYIDSAEFPDFRFKVRISAGDQVIPAVKEVDCIDETLCVSGALPGRSELFLRLLGPRPNGFVWLNLVRFTTSRIQVWVEQISTGEMKYYDLPAHGQADSQLLGLVDRRAFLPEDSVPVASFADEDSPAVPAAPSLTSILSSKNTLVELQDLSSKRSRMAQDPSPVTFTADAFPGYQFTVRISSGGQEQTVQVEGDCIPDTVCVSGALPGRSELFLRIIGPRPNGFLWTNLVRFTTSRIEIEVEQLSSGKKNMYVLEEVPRESDELPGRVDRGAFSP